jgi:hypothetical protein
VGAGAASSDGERRMHRRRGQAARDDSVITLVAGHDADGEVLLVRPDAHLGWRGRADPGARSAVKH